jgi:hypothetical protein
MRVTVLKLFISIDLYEGHDCFPTQTPTRVTSLFPIRIALEKYDDDLLFTDDESDRLEGWMAHQ